MKIYGYENEESALLLKLNMISIEADPAVLRKIAAFISECADSIDKIPGWEHEHFCDYADMDRSLGDIAIYTNKAKIYD